MLGTQIRKGGQSMEVQTFFLSKGLRQLGPGTQFDANFVPLHSFFSTDGMFPLDFEVPYFLLLRRNSRGAEQDVSVKFNLLNSSGESVGEPTDFVGRGKFPGGYMFMSLHGRIKLSFPRIDDYCLRITVQDEKEFPFFYEYHIEVTENPRGA
jgi:hypothetical protein